MSPQQYIKKEKNRTTLKASPARIMMVIGSANCRASYSTSEPFASNIQKMFFPFKTQMKVGLNVILNIEHRIGLTF